MMNYTIVYSKILNNQDLEEKIYEDFRKTLKTRNFSAWTCDMKKKLDYIVLIIDIESFRQLWGIKANLCIY